MEEFAAGTGELFFHNNNDLVGGFEQLAAVPETTYLLAIRPDTVGGRPSRLKSASATAAGPFSMPLNLAL